ncbi:MAG: hypothetical protein ACI4V7_00380 [Succinivibrionaceae bacterium]
MKYPEFYNVNVNNNTIVANFDVTSDLDWCKGHFEEIAIVPGVAQLSFVSVLLRKYLQFNIEEIIRVLDKLKFSKPMLMNDKVEIKIIKDSDKKQVVFEIYNLADHDKLYSSGVMKYN